MDATIDISCNDEERFLYLHSVLLGSSESSWQELGDITIQDTTNFSAFRRSVLVWMNKPHVVNRRLCGAKLLYCEYHITTPTDVRLRSVANNLEQAVYKNVTKTKNPVTNDISECNCNERNISGLKSDLDEQISEITGSISPCSALYAENISCGRATESDTAVFNDCTMDCSIYKQTRISDSSVVDLSDLYKDHREGYVLVIRDLHPREISLHPVIRELVLFDFHLRTVSFVPLCRVPRIGDGKPVPCASEVAYRFQFHAESEKCRISLSTLKRDCAGSDKTQLSEGWLRQTLLRKLASWCGEDDLNTDVTSLRLVAMDEYNAKYNVLKQKYGIPLVKIWPESTDPQKFVYEDVAIAAYLLLLWEAERRELGTGQKQTFVDLGCGNGLLVYLLSSEGHDGVGLDLRKRKIWDLFVPTAKLQEVTITPSANHLFPRHDWIIGNHSDELTPWIPVIAARSSYTSRFFVLPCCAHDFDHKFVTKSRGLSLYQSYVEFVEEVTRVCGLTVERDTLRIPSTKRICLVGRRRNYAERDEAAVDEKRENYINSRCGRHVKVTSGSTGPGATVEGGEAWTAMFNPRPKAERVRNCQRLDKDFKDRVVRTVFQAVLTADNSRVCERYDGKAWRKGGILRLPDVVALFDAECLQQMKSECGGMQTLLRNQHTVFQVSGGNVALRDLTLSDPWGHRAKVKKADRARHRKTSLCWFHEHHPDGCPLSGEECGYAHGAAELKPRPE